MDVEQPVKSLIHVKSDLYMSVVYVEEPVKETYACMKRDLCMCTYMKRDLFVYVEEPVKSLLHMKRDLYMSVGYVEEPVKETYSHMKRDVLVYMYEKRRIYVWKETYICTYTKRDVFIYEKRPIHEYGKG